MASEKFASTLASSATVAAPSVGERLLNVGDVVSWQSTTSSGNPQPLMPSPFRTLFWISMFQRSVRLLLPESLAFIAPGLAALARYETPAMVFARKTLARIKAFWVSAALMAP